MAFCAEASSDRGDRDIARVLDIDLHAGLRDDAADHFSTRADNVANLVLLHLQREYPRREGG